MLNWAARNKYKLMVAFIGLYLVVDVLQHRGMTRVLLPKSFPGKVDSSYPASSSRLVFSGKEWKQAVNTERLLNGLPSSIPGFECDVYYNDEKNFFDVHHDPGITGAPGLETLLQGYVPSKGNASVWLDFKNLTSENQAQALAELIRLRFKFNLTDRILVESSQAELLTAFSDSGFYTSYYTPLFNPYIIPAKDEADIADSLSAILHRSKVNALSGYYFQYPYLKRHFPHYPVLTWSVQSRFSLVSWLFRKKLEADPSVRVVLYP